MLKPHLLLYTQLQRGRLSPQHGGGDNAAVGFPRDKNKHTVVRCFSPTHLGHQGDVQEVRAAACDAVCKCIALIPLAVPTHRSKEQSKVPLPSSNNLGQIFVMKKSLFSSEISSELST